MSDELISIILPTFNREKLVVKCINNLLEQSYSNIEIVVVDDGSTDNTENEVKKIIDKRLRYYKLPENRGACYARNYGINKSKGVYISFQDSDDTYEINKLEKQLKNLKMHSSDFDFCKICIHDGEINSVIPSEERLKEIDKKGITNELINGNFISTQSLLIKKDFLLNYMFDDSLPRFQDYDLVLRMVKTGKVSFTDDVLVNLYRQPDSISNNMSKLQKAIVIFSTKDYGISSDLKKTLIDNLLTLYGGYIRGEDKAIIDKTSNDNKVLISKNEELNKDNICLNDENKKIKMENIALINENKKVMKKIENIKKQNKKLINDNIKINEKIMELRDNYAVLNENYGMIISSKRYKLIDKLMKIIGR